MKRIDWVDDRGYRRSSIVRDSEGEVEARAGVGIPVDPPNVELIDWEAVKRDLHNALIQHGIISWDQVKTSNSGLATVLIKSLKPHVMRLFKEVLR